MSGDPSRAGADYADAWSKLLPTGPAWPRERDSVLMRVVGGLAQVWGDDIDVRAHALRDREAFPGSAVELIADWERVVGLPDDCCAETAPFDRDGVPLQRSWFVPGGGIAFRAGRSRCGKRPWRQTDRFNELMTKLSLRFGGARGCGIAVPDALADRQQLVVARLTAEGGQSRAYFIALAAALGYPTVQILEFSPVRAGRSRCGSGAWRIGSPLYRFFWRMRVGAAPVTWFRAGRGVCGRDPQARIARAALLECLVRRWKPAHTDVQFLYTISGET